MMAFYPIYSYNQNLVLSKIVTFFRDKGALTPDKAVKISSTDFLQMGWMSTNLEIAKFYIFLQKTPDGNYWLDESKVDDYFVFIQRQSKKLTIIFFGIVVGIPLLLLLFLVLRFILLGSY